MKITRRQFLAGIGAVAAAAASVPAYARYLEPRWLRVSRVTAPFFSTPVQRPLRILHLSDFHYSRVIPLAFIERAIDMGIRKGPTCAVITGDLITHGIEDEAAYIRILSTLAEHTPTYAVLGNHDGGRWARTRGGYPDTARVRRLFQRSGIQLLHNESIAFEHEDRAIRVIGVGDLWAGEMDPEAAFRDVPSPDEQPRIVLAHNPDSKDAMGDRAWELMLSGHTHGGQVALPFVGTPFAPVQDHRFVEGLNRWHDRWIHTTRGVGNLHGIRFNCRPEISVVDLVGAR